MTFAVLFVVWTQNQKSQMWMGVIHGSRVPMSINKLLSFKKRTAIRGPYVCVSNGNVSALRLSELPTTLHPRFYIITCAEGDL